MSQCLILNCFIVFLLPCVFSFSIYLYFYYIYFIYVSLLLLSGLFICNNCNLTLMIRLLILSSFSFPYCVLYAKLCLKSTLQIKFINIIIIHVQAPLYRHLATRRDITTTCQSAVARAAPRLFLTERVARPLQERRTAPNRDDDDDYDTVFTLYSQRGR